MTRYESEERARGESEEKKQVELVGGQVEERERAREKQGQVEQVGPRWKRESERERSRGGTSRNNSKGARRSSRHEIPFELHRSGAQVGKVTSRTRAGGQGFAREQEAIVDSGVQHGRRPSPGPNKGAREVKAPKTSSTSPARATR